jgi:hypothetical protein
MKDSKCAGQELAMKTISDKIRQRVTEAKPALLKIPPEAARTKPGPNRWSKQEMLGHLVDSAANNHQRIVRGALNLAGDFPPYQQDLWVATQRYNDADWPGLVELFSQYNLHLARVIEYLPPEILENPCNIGKDEPVTLRFVIDDYLRHLEHHLDKLV